MDRVWSDGYNDEIDRCQKYYCNFKEGAGFIRDVFSVLQDYYQKNPGKAMPIANLPLSIDKATDLMRKDQSLVFRPEIDRDLFCDLLNLSCHQIIKTNASLNNIVSDLKAKTEAFRATSDLSISLDKIEEFRETLLSETEIGNDLLAFLFSIVLSSIYRRLLEPISEVLRTDLYEGGDCPLCGEKPHYGMLKAEDGAKYLDCWLCGTRWMHARVKCPYCSNEEREELGYFTIDEEEICRVHYCQACCCYYKIFDTRQFNADGGIILAIHNLASLEFDLLARKEGFSSGSGLEWINEREIVEDYRKD